MSSSFSGSVQALVRKASEAITRNDLNSALQMVHDFVEKIITEPLCTSQVFASKDLDQLCLRIGAKNLASIDVVHEDPCVGWHSGNRVAYLVTRLQRSGGHSRLVQDFIRAQPQKNHLVILTGVAGSSDLDHYKSIFADANNVRFIVVPRGRLLARLTWTQKLLRAYKPEHVQLFNHHQDAVAVAALVPEIGLHGSFFHHGDHHLCLGVHYTHLKHIDFHPMGYHYCRDTLGIENQYLPLTFQDRGGAFPHESRGFERPLITATVARSNKIEIPYYVSYVDTIPMVLKVTGGTHIHIGKLTPWAIRHMRKKMKRLGVPDDRLVYVEWTGSVWKSLQELGVDVYLASFPYGAGLTLIEAMGAGVPVIMHQHMYSRVLSGLELAYPGAFSWSDPNDLLKHLEHLKPASLHQEGQLARQQFAKFHRPEILKNFFDESEKYTLSVPQLYPSYSPRLDEWAAWVERQSSIRHMLYRAAYRAWRSLRRLRG